MEWGPSKVSHSGRGLSKVRVTGIGDDWQREVIGCLQGEVRLNSLGRMRMSSTGPKACDL